MDSIQVGAEEGTAVGGELKLNRWFISRLQDLQPSLPTSSPCLEGRGAELGPDVSSLSPSMEGSATRGQGEGRKSGRGTDSFAGNPSSSTRVCLLEPLPAAALGAADVVWPHRGVGQPVSWRSPVERELGAWLEDLPISVKTNSGEERLRIA